MNLTLPRRLAAFALFALAALRAEALSISETVTHASSGTFAPGNDSLVAIQPFAFHPLDATKTLESVTMTTSSVVPIFIEWTNTTNAAITAPVGASFMTNYANYTGFWNFGEGYTEIPSQLFTTNPGQTKSFSATFTHSTTTSANRYQPGWAAYVWDGSDPSLFSYTTFNSRLGFGSTLGMTRTGTYTAQETATLTYAYITPDAGATTLVLFAGACAVLLAVHRCMRISRPLRGAGA